MRLQSTGEWVSGEGAKQLFFTDGTGPRLRGKGIYFLRTTDAEDGVDLGKASDDTVLFGEIGEQPLQVLESTLNTVYKPHFEASGDWGKARKPQTKEFLKEVDKFLGGVQASLKSLGDGIDLPKPEKRYDLDNVARLTAQSKEDPAMIKSFEAILESWCTRIQKYLDDKEPSAFTAADAGPLNILEYWRRRMQSLTSITEQLKTKDCKAVVSVLAAVTKSPSDPQRQAVFALMRRWKQIDLQITEAANEAKDNVKYLFTLEKFIEPLYSGTPLTIVDTLPALMNSIKMIHTIARYFNTTERMTDLFVKITNQMIMNCKRHVVSVQEEETGDKLWQKDPQQLVVHLEACLKLNEAYQEQYRLTKDKLLTQPKGKQFDFSETQIFGKFDLFCRRTIKLIDMFSTIHQFQSLADHKLEGMEGLIEQFFAITKEFQNKRHELLDFHNNKVRGDHGELRCVCVCSRMFCLAFPPRSLIVITSSST